MPTLTPTPPLTEPADHQLAAELAAGALSLLMDQRAGLESRGVDPSEWGDVGDRLANDWLLAALAAARPHDAVLSEESADDLSRLHRSRVWIIDPLDGTREFAAPGRTDWAVHVALSIDGAPLVGAVALPDGRVLGTAAPVAPPPRTGDGPLRLVVSRSRPPTLADAVAADVGAVVSPLGSAGAKIAAVVSGEADIYLHAGGMSQWDSCAPVAAALAAGVHASRLDGSPLRYNEADVSLPDLVVCRAELAADVLRSVQRHR